MKDLRKTLPVVVGGEPLFEKNFPYGRQCISSADIEIVTAVLKSEWITQGPEISIFEDKLAKQCNSRFAIALSSGTCALHAACAALRMKPGEEVITSPYTFAASSNCILYVGGKPIFVDIDPATWNIDSKEIERNITENTRALIAIDFAGLPCDYLKLREICDSRGIVLISDACHSLGATYRGNPVGSFADMTIFSFHPVKHITTGEGGAVVTNDPAIAEYIKLFRTHGMTRDADRFEIKGEGPWYHEMQELGHNFRLTSFQAALGASQLDLLKQWVERRQWIAKRYREAFFNLPVTFQCQMEDRASSYHLFILSLKLDSFKIGRKSIFEALQKEGLGVQVHYLPVHLHPYYKRMGWKRGDFPKAEQLYESAITIPLFPAMTDEEVENVINAVSRVLNYYEK